MKRELFGQRVRLCRERLGMTQFDLATRAGLQPSAVSFFETGVRLPSLDNLLAVADALGESLDTLTGRAEGMRPIGKEVETLLARFGAMRDEDRKTILELAKHLAERAKSPFIDVPDEAFRSPEDRRWESNVR